jgi:hypothetical protein
LTLEISYDVDGDVLVVDQPQFSGKRRSPFSIEGDTLVIEGEDGARWWFQRGPAL